MKISRLLSIGCLVLAGVCGAQERISEAGSDQNNLPPLGGSSEVTPVVPVFGTLAGELPDIVSATGGPYVVTGDIVVPPGKTVTIEPGTFFLFRSFTGLQVHGTLIAVGTKEKPIAFTSEHDQKHGSLSTQEPAPYDWNGITITENAVGTKFEYCRIGYSLYGINSLTEYFTIKDCMFRKNGKADVTIKGTKQDVASGVPYSYQPLGEAPVQAVVRQESSAAKITLRTSAIAVCAAGCAVGIWKALDYRESAEDFETVNNVNNVANLRNPTIVQDWESAKNSRDTNLLWMVVGFGVGVLGAAGFTVTLFF